MKELENFDSLTNFDKKSIKRLPTVCKESIDAIAADIPNRIMAESPVNSATISSISVCCLIVAVEVAKILWND